MIALGNLVWEFAQIRLYTIWLEHRLMARDRLRCSSLHGRRHSHRADVTDDSSGPARTLAWPLDRFGPVAALTIAMGMGYTILSEYLNIVIRAAWAYSDQMLVISLGG